MLIFLVVSVFSQTLTTRYSKVIRNTFGKPVSGLLVQLYNTETTVLAYNLLESESTPGTYYHNSVSIGQYDIYINSIKKESGIWIGGNKLSIISNKFNSNGELGNTGIQNNAVTTPKILDANITIPKLSQAVIDLVSSGGNVTNNPDDITLETKPGSVIGVKDAWINTVFSEIEIKIGNINYETLSEAVATIGGNYKTIIITENQSVVSDLIIPSNIIMKFTKNSILSVDYEKTLTINGYVDAGYYQIFDTSGNIDLSNSKNSEINPIWFGAKSDSTQGGVTQRAFQSSVNSLGSSGKLLKIPEGIYLIDETPFSYQGINLQYNTNWEGEGDKTILSFPGATVAVGSGNDYRSNYDLRNATFKNFKMMGQASWINKTTPSSSTIQVGLYLHWGTGQAMWNKVVFDNISMENWSSTTIAGLYCRDVLIQNCSFKNCAWYQGAAITMAGIDMRIFNNYISECYLGMELVCEAAPPAPDTTYSLLVSHNIVKAQYYGLRTYSGNNINISDNEFTWQNLTGTDDNIQSGTLIQMASTNITNLSISRNVFNGSQTQVTFYEQTNNWNYPDTSHIIKNTIIENNIFMNAGAFGIQFNKNYYLPTTEFTIKNNTFYRWSVGYGTAIGINAISITGLPKLNIENNMFFTETGYSTNALWLKNIDSLIIKNNSFPNRWIYQGTNNYIDVSFNNYPSSITKAYQYYTAPSTYEDRQQIANVDMNGLHSQGLTLRTKVITNDDEVIGKIVLDSDDSKIKTWDGTEWITLSNKKLLIKEVEDDIEVGELLDYGVGIYMKDNLFKIATVIDGGLKIKKMNLLNNDSVFTVQDTLGAELLTDKSFEIFTGTPDDGTTDDWTNWIESPTLGKIDATIDSKFGYAVKIINSTGADVNVIRTLGITVTPETNYRLTYWTKGDGTYQGKITLRDVTNSTYFVLNEPTGVTDDIWTLVTYDFTSPAGCLSILVYFYGNTTNISTIMYDSISLKEIL